MEDLHPTPLLSLVRVKHRLFGDTLVIRRNLRGRTLEKILVDSKLLLQIRRVRNNPFRTLGFLLLLKHAQFQSLHQAIKSRQVHIRYTDISIHVLIKQLSSFLVSHDVFQEYTDNYKALRVDKKNREQ